jgi:hypothetical protein
VAPRYRAFFLPNPAEVGKVCANFLQRERFAHNGIFYFTGRTLSSGLAERAFDASRGIGVNLIGICVGVFHPRLSLG